MHFHGEFNHIPPENVKNMKIITVYNIHDRGKNCTLLLPMGAGNPCGGQRVRLGPANSVKARK